MRPQPLGSIVAACVLAAACSSSTSPTSSTHDAGKDTGHSSSRGDATTHPDAMKMHADATPPRADGGHDATLPPKDGGSDVGPDVFDALAFDAGVPLPAWLTEADIFINGFDAAAANQNDCHTQICQHNEDTDMIAWKGAIYMVHRTAMSQVLGPNSSLLIYKSVNDGVTFQQVARIQAPETPIDADDTATMGRDIRDPAFFIVKDAQGTETLHLKAITRLPTDISIDQTRDSNVESISVGFSSVDGSTWGPLTRLAPNQWSFWRPKEVGGVFYDAAYHDGDSSVSLYSSSDGVTWTLGAQVFGVTADTPLETELVPFPNGNMLAIVRTDGDDADLNGNDGNQRTHLCWASPPYSSWACPETILGERFDGPVAYLWQGRLFLLARRSVDSNGVRNRKRTSLFELSPAAKGTADAGADGGVLVTVDSGVDAAMATSVDWGMPPPDAGDGGTEGGAFDSEPILAVKWWGDIPSAGDTAYAGVAFTDANHLRVVWYSGDVVADVDWIVSLLGPTSIWLGSIDMTLVH